MTDYNCGAGRGMKYISTDALGDTLENLKERIIVTYAELVSEIAAIPAADVVSGRDFRDCRNELCLHCGNYKNAHEGACDGCRWRAGNG